VNSLMVVSSEQVALVTGANRGIGLEVTRQLVRRGFTVILGSRDLAKGETAARPMTEGGLRVIPKQLDVIDQKSIDELKSWLDELSKKESEILPYLLQRALVRHLSIPAEKAGRRDLLPLWAGQSARLSHGEDVNAFLSNLVTQVSEIAGSVQRWSATRSSPPQPETS